MDDPWPHDGLLILDKPRGPSSHQVTAWAGELLNRSVGHAGTLDPGVSGVLVIMIGHTSGLAPLLLAEEKEYVCAMQTHGDVPQGTISEVLPRFTGRIYQRPPRKSAVARNLRIRSVHALDLLDEDGRSYLFRIRCDAGTYIRSLCHHMGLALGTGAHMEELRRVRSGCFSETETYTLQDLADGVAEAQEGDLTRISTMILPPAEGLHSISRIIVRDTAVDAVCHGARLAVPGIFTHDKFGKGDTIALFTSGEELIGVGKALISSEELKDMRSGLVAAPVSVFLEPGRFPKGWKKKPK